MANSKVAVVTGSNRGIGFATVRGLCKDFEGDVFLTARDESRGIAAVEAFNKEGLYPLFHQLDITDPKSVEELAKFLKTNYGGLDLLVNNAGIAFKDDSTLPIGDQAEKTIGTNFWGTLSMCRTMSPILKSHARVVNVSGFLRNGAIAECSSEIQRKINSTVNFENIENVMKEFVRSAKNGNIKGAGFCENIYGMSKVGVAAISNILQRDVDKDKSRSDIVVNACCPGLTNTGLLSVRGSQTIDQGADTPLYLALLPSNIKSPRGEFLFNRKIYN